jgi:hypothetical protein
MSHGPTRSAHLYIKARADQINPVELETDPARCVGPQGKPQDRSKKLPSRR